LSRPPASPTPPASPAPPRQVIKRTGEIVPFDRTKVVNAIYKAAAAVGGHDRALSERLADQVVTMLARSGGTPSVEEIQDLAEKVLIENGHAKTAKAYILYRNERARLREQKGGRRVTRDDVPFKAMWRALVFNLEHDCHTVDGLVRHVRNGTFPDLVAAAEEVSEAEVAEAANAVLAARDRVRLVFIAGPSSSGKTTTTAKIASRLREAGIEVVPLNMDNYFFDLHLHPRDESGDYDFETPEALDLRLINEHLAALLAGREIAVPIYDFKLGRRLEARVPLRLPPHAVLLLDTLHGLYDGLSASVPDACKFRVYLETVLQLRDGQGRWVRWTDLRLLRRMLRDSRHRNYDPEQTLLHWHYVRRGELKHIIPHIGRADAVVNGGLPYELPILARHLAHLFPRFLAAWEGDPARAEALSRARRVAALLDEMEPAEDDCVPPTSVLREFIGGSAYKVH
jgi:uridine kinase